MTIPAKSVMTTDIVTVSPETTVVDTARRMLIHHVSAVPVVDPDNRPLGLVSEGDVMRHFSAQFQSKRAQWLGLLAEGETLAPEFLAAQPHDILLYRNLLGTHDCLRRPRCDGIESQNPSQFKLIEAGD